MVRLQNTQNHVVYGVVAALHTEQVLGGLGITLLDSAGADEFSGCEPSLATRSVGCWPPVVVGGYPTSIMQCRVCTSLAPFLGVAHQFPISLSPWMRANKRYTAAR